MGSSLALIVYSTVIAGLFYLDRDKSVRTSPALWLPVIWLWIIGSRPVSAWFEGTPTSDAALQAMQLDGSEPDRLIFQILLFAAIIVIILRARRARGFLVASWPILIYFFYCLVSILWSDFPGVASKRWIKAVGDLVMILVVVTDAQPIAALKRYFSRTGFILLPASLLLIKYFPDLGRSYDPWFGTSFETGVTLNKNALGVITLVLSLAAAWRVLTFLRSGKTPDRGRHLFAHGVLLAIGVLLLIMAHSATSLACFAAGAGVMLVTGLPSVGRRPATVHAVVILLLLLAGVVVLFGGEGDVVQALGRNTTFTGRTDIWKLVLPMAPNAFVGSGFESFWLGTRLQNVWAALPNLHVNEAHNGYIETYLNLGWVGLCSIVVILIDGYRRSVATFRRYPELGNLLLAYVVVSVFYSITEAGFRMLNPMWTFLLLAVVTSGGIMSGDLKEPSPRRIRTERASRLPAKDRIATKVLARST